MALKLSIIVPVYKVEPYLRKCVDSLLEQDLSSDEYEIILVDDGSPDNCGAICDEYASKYSHIRVIHRPNGGLSAARNSGIEVARGEYVQFVDSDDYLEPNVLKYLVNKMEQDDLDVLRFNYQNVNERYEVFDPNKASKRFVNYSDSICDGVTFLNERLGYACYAVQFMIKRSLLADCRFKEGIYFEDTEWTPRLLMKANKITSTDKIVYNYMVRQGSITRSVDDKKKRKVLDDKLLLIGDLEAQMVTVYDKRWFEGMIALTALSFITYISHHFYEQRSQYLDNLKKSSVFPLSDYHSTRNAKRKIIIANISPGLLCFLMNKLKFICA